MFCDLRDVVHHRIEIRSQIGQLAHILQQLNFFARHGLQPRNDAGKTVAGLLQHTDQAATVGVLGQAASSFLR